MQRSVIAPQTDQGAITLRYITPYSLLQSLNQKHKLSRMIAIKSPARNPIPPGLLAGAIVSAC